MSAASSNTRQSGAVVWDRWFVGFGICLLMIAVAFMIIPDLVSMLMSTLPLLVGFSSVQIDEWRVNAPAATLIYQICAGVLALWVIYLYCRVRKISIRKLMGIYRPRVRDPLYAVAGYMAYAGIFTVLTIFLQAFTTLDVGKEQALAFNRDVSGLALVVAFVGLVIVPPIVEETVFRGFVYGTLRAHAYSAVAATIVTSICFAALHLAGSTDGSLLWIAFIDTCLLSFALCYVREKTGSIWASMGIHALKNGVVFVNLFLLGNS